RTFIEKKNRYKESQQQNFNQRHRAKGELPELDPGDTIYIKGSSKRVDGGVFGGEIEDCVPEVLKTCPLTNLTGERMFGDFDYCINVRRNASLLHRSTRNMWKRNRTEKFLSDENPDKTRQLVKRAIEYGPVYKKRNVLEKQKLLEIRKAKGADVQQIKEEKTMKLLERKKAALDAVLAKGRSVITDKAELDDI
ncbi:hypothetical protein RRG08_048112, partial [Elysia crispata]